MRLSAADQVGVDLALVWGTNAEETATMNLIKTLLVLNSTIYHV